MEALLTRIHEEIRSDPEGEIARLAYRAALDVHLDVPPFGLLSEPQTISVATGGLLPTFLLPERMKVVWNAQIYASADGKPPARVMTSTWNSQELHLGGKSLPLREVMGPDSLTQGPHRLSFHAVIARYPASVDPENLGASVALEEETRDLGSFPISLFSGFPPDFPAVLMSDEPLEKFLDISTMKIVSLTLPPRTGPCIRFTWPGSNTVETICPPPGDLPRHDLIAGFDLMGALSLDESRPIAMAASVSVNGSDRPMLSFELSGLEGCMGRIHTGHSWHLGWDIEDARFTLGRGGTCTSISGTYLRALLKGPDAETLYFSTGLTRNTPIQAELRFTPSRSVALSTRRLDRYIGNAATLPIQLTVHEAAGTWTEGGH
jgi:hypothetical protein